MSCLLKVSTDLSSAAALSQVPSSCSPRPVLGRAHFLWKLGDWGTVRKCGLRPLWWQRRGRDTRGNQCITGPCVPPASTHCSLEEKLHKQHLDSQTHTMDVGRRSSVFRHGHSLRASSDDAQAMGLRGQRESQVWRVLPAPGVMQKDRHDEAVGCAVLTGIPRALRMFILHMGQVRWSRSQGSTQDLWKRCLQWEPYSLERRQLQRLPSPLGPRRLSKVTQLLSGRAKTRTSVS